ncbi:hypothetical protein C2U49_27880 (plasmid) [Klebsiella pneumoniae]|nr:hypothetical protein C2U55_29660 [Enterobacteriaceae bacterium ENNIH3]AUU98544.1 hypothetical protein C2U49_27880 [Klebsiella pneumoniae]POV60730.1 hypothetical protein C3411_24390 [Citrobacter freundii complex sp. CFNIH5]
MERGWRRGATRSSYRGRDQAGATDVILDIKRLLLSPGNTSISPENIAGQSLSEWKGLPLDMHLINFRAIMG